MVIPPPPPADIYSVSSVSPAVLLITGCRSISDSVPARCVFAVCLCDSASASQDFSSSTIWIFFIRFFAISEGTPPRDVCVRCTQTIRGNDVLRVLFIDDLVEREDERTRPVVGPAGACELREPGCDLTLASV